MRLRRKLFSNTFYLFLNWFASTLLGFAYWIIAGKVLLPEEYGIISTSLNLAVLLSGIAFLGLGPTIGKLLPEYLAKNRKSETISLLRCSFKTIFSLYLIITVFFILFLNFLSSFIKLSMNVILISIIITCALIVSNFFGTVIYAFQEMREFFTSNFSGQLVKVILSAFLIFFGFRYYGPLFGLFFSFLTIALIRVKISYSLINFLKKGKKINFKNILKEYSLPAFISFLAWTFFMNGQYVLLTILKTTEVTGIFTIAMLITSIIATFPNILTQALFPMISFLSADSKVKSQSYLIRLVLKYVFLFSLPMAFLLSIFSKPMILIFSRPEYLPASTLFPILVSASLTYGVGNLLVSNLYAIGKTKIQRNIWLLTVTIFFVSTIFLVNKFSALGMALSYLLSTLILISLGYLYIRKFLPLELPLKSFVKCLFSASISFLFLYFITKFTTDLIDYLLTIFSGVIYLLILLIMKFYSSEDIRILEIIEEKIPFLKIFTQPLIRFLSNYVQKRN
jgi:PST family polysaccharide transporter